MKIILTNVPLEKSKSLRKILKKEHGPNIPLLVALSSIIPSPPKKEQSIWMRTDSEISRELVEKVLEVYKGYGVSCLIGANKKMPHLDREQAAYFKDVPVFQCLPKPGASINFLVEQLDLAPI